MQGKKLISFPLVLFIIAVAVVGFLLTMGNYIAALCVTLIVLVLTFYWQWPNFLSIRGQSEYARGNNTKALSLLKKAHESSRARTANSTAYAYILLRCGQTEEAANVLNYVLLNQKLKQQEKLQARQILSLVRYRQGDFAEATRLMEMVFAGYKNSGVYGALGYYKILSDAPDAQAFNEEAYEYNSDDKIIIDNMIILCLKNGDIARAKELSDKSVNAGNKGVEIFYRAAQVEEALGNDEEALEYYKKAASCTRSFMTTVAEKDIDNAVDMLKKRLGKTLDSEEF